MAWFGDSLSSLSNLKGQITNFTKEVLSEGIVEEIDERSKELNEANERCSKLQDLLSSKDAEISLLRRQNCELQKTVIEIKAKLKESDTNHIDETEAVIWDPSCVYNRNARNQNHIRQLQEQLAQATVRIRDLECELKRMQKVNNTSLKDDIPDAHQKAEVLRAKQDMINRIIQIEEKTREAERNARRIQVDETILINDFRSVISKLDCQEKFDLLTGALRALQIESGRYGKSNKNHEKSDFDENSERYKTADKTEESSCLFNKEEILHKRIEVLQNENKDLLDTMEKLDEEYTQSIEKLLSLREETDKKHQCLQNAYEQLSIDYNEAQKKIIIIQNNDIDLKFNKDTCTEKNYQFAQTDKIDILEKYTQTTFSPYEDNSMSETNILDDIIQKVKKILKNYSISNIESDESIFELIAEQYVDTRWKLDILERKVTEITRDLKESEEIKDSLQIECEELQSHIDSLLLENEALKSSLPSIPEASEERVACLETDVEHLHEEVKRLVTENEKMRETNTALITQLAIQNKDIPLKGHEQLETEIKKIINQCSTWTNDHNSLEEIAVNRSCLTKKEKLGTSIELSIDNSNKLIKDKNTDLLHDLQKQLDKANSEKSVLQNNILYKEKELDEIQIQIDMKQSQVIKLNQDNDRLIKENVSLSEQLIATHDESLDKIELLNTEMTLLQQEHEDLKQETSTCKDKLNHTKENLNKVREHNTELENECRALKMLCEIEKENWQSKITEKTRRIDELETEFQKLKDSTVGELNFMQDKCKFLEQEIEMFRIKELQSSEFQKNISEISLVKFDKINQEIKQKFHITEDGLKRIENKDITSNNNDRWTSESTVADKKQEDMKTHNEQLMNEIIDLRSKLETVVENKEESAKMAKQTIEDLSHLVREKDNEIDTLRIEITRTRNIITQTSSEFVAIKNQKDELEQLITTKSNEILQYQNEIQKLIQHMNIQAAHIQSLNEQMANASALKDKNTEISNKTKEQFVEQSTQREEITALNEKCNALESALIQEQSNNRILQSQLIESRNKEKTAAKELERLRTHLVEMESSYTEEAIIAEKSRQELETRLSQAEEKMKNNSTAYTSANIRANQQVETLQQQIALIIQQRDHIQNKLSAAEDNILLQAASLTNLQIVLEQFQQDKESDIMSTTERIRSQLNNSYKKQEEFLSEISILKQQLSEAKECLQAASRLSEQLEKKDEQISRLNEEVARLTSLVNSTDQKIKETMENNEGKVDKILIKNLLLGYLSSTTTDKSSILRVFATVLDFTESEKNKTGLSNIITQSTRAVNNVSSKDQEASLSTAFVRFLESESKPKPQLPALPILNSPSSRSGLGNKQQSPSSSTQSTLLLANVALPTFPDFIPARNTGSILKEVLKDS